MSFIRPTKSHPISDDFHDHVARGSVNPGTDYAVKSGTPVYAVADGTVVGVTTSIAGAGGRMVWLNCADGYNFDYLHLSKIVVGKGQKVKQGDLLGYSGGSGRGSEKGYGAHLHFSARIGGSHVNRKGNFDFEAFLRGKKAPAAQPKGKPVLKMGSTGSAVMTLQRKLKVAADGEFGPITRAAVKKFQKAHSLVADGIVGPMTWKALG